MVTRGKIITFYSYKGGTGRSMLLANVAWVLASNGKRVLVIDWDLEAPGLHRYFRPFLPDPELTSTTGLIDFLWDFANAAMTQATSPSPDWYHDYANILRYADSLQWQFPGIGMLDFVSAGQQSASYRANVNSLNWDNFYSRLGGGLLFEAVKERVRDDYDYILIDSRTGVSDMAGICTVQFPDCLVVCFTMNRQSIAGVAEVARSVAAQRQERTTTPIKIFPVPTRIDSAEVAMLEQQRAYVRHAFDFPGSPYLTPREYWGSVEIPYYPRYSYYELLAAFVDNPSDPKSLLGAILRLTSFLTDGDVREFNVLFSPEERERVLRNFSGDLVDHGDF